MGGGALTSRNCMVLAWVASTQETQTWNRRESRWVTPNGPEGSCGDRRGRGGDVGGWVGD